MSDKQRIHAFVSGRVQGVGFRYFTERTAKSYKLVGQVRNLGDGRVEVYAEGDKDQIKKFLSALKRGPGIAHVADIDVDWLPPQDTFQDFRVVY